MVGLLRIGVTKPKVVVLMLMTSLVGMFLATRAGVPWTVLVFGNLGIALCAGGAAVINHVVDRRIDALPAHRIARGGLVLVPEGRQVFPELTVVENIRLGAFGRVAPQSQERADARAIELAHQCFGLFAGRAYAG